STCPSRFWGSRASSIIVNAGVFAPGVLYKIKELAIDFYLSGGFQQSPLDGALTGRLLALAPETLRRSTPLRRKRSASLCDKQSRSSSRKAAMNNLGNYESKNL